LAEPSGSVCSWPKPRHCAQSSWTTPLNTSRHPRKRGDRRNNIRRKLGLDEKQYIREEGYDVANPPCNAPGCTHQRPLEAVPAIPPVPETAHQEVHIHLDTPEAIRAYYDVAFGPSSPSRQPLYGGYVSRMIAAGRLSLIVFCRWGSTNAIISPRSPASSATGSPPSPASPVQEVRAASLPRTHSTLDFTVYNPGHKIR